MATFNKFNAFVEAVAKKQHNLGADTLKVMLTNTAPAAGNSVTSDITEIAPGNGYAAGGAAAAISSAAQAGGTFKLVIADVVFTATGAVGPFRYAVLYNATAGLLIGWYDYGSALTLATGETLTVDFDQTNGVLTLA